jgi:hypothetical protein
MSSEQSVNTDTPPPRLKLKLRHLAPKPASPPSIDTQTAVTVSVRNDTSSERIEPVPKQRGRRVKDRWKVFTPSSGPTTPLFNQTKKTGSMNDPIDVDTLNSPPPHKFLDRSTGYSAPLPLQYRPLRPKLAPKFLTPNGALIDSGRIGSHESHDIYREFAAKKKVVTPPRFTELVAQMKSKIGRPAAPQPYPNGYAAYLDASMAFSRGAIAPQNLQPYQPSFATYQTPINGYPIFTTQNEEALRKRAVQYVLDDSRPRPRKRRLPDDPDQTSGSEYENEPVPRTTEKPRTPKRQKITSTVSTPSTGASEENMFDRNLKLTELVEHTQLVTGLLMSYPYSTDQAGLREDLSMLASVSNKRLQAWFSAERDIDADMQERRRFSTGATTLSPSEHWKARLDGVNAPKDRGTPTSINSLIGAQQELEKQAQAQGKLEDEMRSYLSTHSDFWTQVDGNKITTQIPSPAESAATTDLTADAKTAGGVDATLSPPLPFSDPVGLSTCKPMRRYRNILPAMDTGIDADINPSRRVLTASPIMEQVQRFKGTVWDGITGNFGSADRRGVPASEP